MFSGCRATCAYNDNDKLNAGWDFEYDPKQAKFCASGCQASPDVGVYYDMKNGMRFGPLIANGGWTCKASNAPVPTPQPPTPANPPKPTPCESGEGVLTFSDGRLGCVPSGTPDAQKPNVTTNNKTSTYPDGTTSTTTETVTRDPKTQAVSTTTKTTTTAKPDGTAGQAGAPGTVITGNDKGGNGSGGGDGGGSCDPTLNFCGGPDTSGLYTKKTDTVQSVLEQFKSDMEATPVIHDFTSFFNITVPTGACPDLSVSIPYLNTTINMAQYICSATANQYLDAMGAVLQVAVSFLAFTWILL